MPRCAAPPAKRRRGLLSAALALLVLVELAAPPAAARQATRRAAGRRPARAPATRPHPGRYWLRVVAEQVKLRSRPDANSLAVALLPRDSLLRAIDSRFGWHRVLPPAGVFSLVSARYVIQRPDGTGIVAVRRGNLRVRVGSRLYDLDPLACEAQTLLPAGAQVRIVGRRDGWLKIVPPAGVFLYVAQRQVVRVSEAAAARLLRARAPASRPSGPSAPPRPPASSGPSSSAAARGDRPR